MSGLVRSEKNLGLPNLACRKLGNVGFWVGFFFFFTSWDFGNF